MGAPVLKQLAVSKTCIRCQETQVIELALLVFEMMSQSSMMYMFIDSDGINRQSCIYHLSELGGKLWRSRAGEVLMIG